jgi:hypothetical protein
LACGAVLRLCQIPLGIGEANRGRRRENALRQGAARFALVDYAALGRRGHFIGICGEGQSRDGLPIWRQKWYLCNKEQKRGDRAKMKRLKILMVLIATVGLWHCGGDGGNGNGNGNGPIPVGPPEAPGELRVEKIGDGEVWLNWQASADDGDVLYIVYRAVGDSGTVAVDSTFLTSFQDRVLEYKQEYTYYVTALNTAGGQSGPSNSVSGQPFNNLAPLAPVTVRAIAHNISILDQLDIVLDWAENGEADLAGYRVYRSTEGGLAPDATLLQREVVVPRFVDEDIEVGTVYYYLITAFDRGGKESAVSTEVHDVALPLPVLLDPVTGGLVPAEPIFIWGSMAEARSFRVVVTSSPTSGEVSAMPLTSDTTAVFVARVEAGSAVELASGQIYYWKVVASTQEGGVENSVSQVESFKIR